MVNELEQYHTEIAFPMDLPTKVEAATAEHNLIPFLFLFENRP